MNRISSKIIAFYILFALVAPVGVFGAMQSQSYVIYENVLHEFDGPVVSNISVSSAEKSVTVTWTTNVPSDSFVVYDTNSDFSTAMEQGNTSYGTSHSVEIVGLDSATNYYFKPKSTRPNGGTTLYATAGNFTFPTVYTSPTAPAPQAPASGGGMMIIDKTDKNAPIISNIQVIEVTGESAKFTWDTDEDSTSFVEYGIDANFGSIYGQWDSAKQHSVKIGNLDSGTQYTARILSSDSWGNLAKSEAVSFKTTGEPPVPESEEVKPAEIGIDGKTREELLANASAKIIELMNKLSGQVSLGLLQTTLQNQFDAIEKLANFIPAPILSGEPRVDIGADRATIFWQTDKDANSMVAYAPEGSYDIRRTEPYIQLVGSNDERVQNHEVTLYNLKSNTLYHYQLRSKAALGPQGTTRDFTFRTRIESLSITSLMPEIIDNVSAKFKWVTNKEANSSIKFAPYRNGALSVDETKEYKDSLMTQVHEITIKEFEAGVTYAIEVQSQDAQKNVATDKISMFTTGQDTTAPEISMIRTDSTIFADKQAKTQTIISWKTNEQSTSKVFYQEGVQAANSELKESTELNPSYSREHIFVINKFKPGTVYSFRVESVDSSGNDTLSDMHTFMTPKKNRSIIQVIIDIIQNTFGWTKNLLG